jgi:hypothetical protein
MLSPNQTIVILQRRNIVFPEFNRGMGMKEFGVAISQGDPLYSSSLLPIGFLLLKERYEFMVQ